jgi:hypothetical protein
MNVSDDPTRLNSASAGSHWVPLRPARSSAQSSPLCDAPLERGFAHPRIVTMSTERNRAVLLPSCDQFTDFLPPRQQLVAFTHPVGHCRTLQLNARARINLRLAIYGK